MNHILKSLILLITLAVTLGAVVGTWYLQAGFLPHYKANWIWLVKDYIPQYRAYPYDLLQSAQIVVVAGVGVMLTLALYFNRASTSTLVGGRRVRDTHGSARWAKWGEIKRMGLLGESGVVVGGVQRLGKIKRLRHNGPEHVLCFAPTRSGKGVGLVLPTLLEWEQSVLVLDIKGENYAKTAGYRKSLGHNVILFEPAAESGSAKYNPLAEVRLGTGHEIADCQNIASMVIDPAGKGLKDYWMQSGWEWLSASILHVLYRVRKEQNRTATLADVHQFMSVGDKETVNADGEIVKLTGDESFDHLCDSMVDYDHGHSSADEEVARAASSMKKKASSERSGVHSSAKTQLALYSDPIVAKNISDCDFRIDDLVNGDAPAALYIVIGPNDIDRLKPLIRILVNQFLTRLTAQMGQNKHRLLLMLDEFTAIGKLELFERALAFMAGYGIKAFIIVQDLTQLQKEYGKEEAIVSNCHIRIAYAPNKIETARLLSDMAGKATLIQRKRSSSLGGKGGGSESQSEVGRPLLTPDECMSLPGLKVDNGKIRATGDMLIFSAGDYPIYGKQSLYFTDKILTARAEMTPPQLPFAFAEAAPQPQPTEEDKKG